MTSNPLFYLILILCFVVVIILARGLGNFAKGGAEAAKQSNKMMRWRIIAQAAAVLLIVLVGLFGGLGGSN